MNKEIGKELRAIRLAKNMSLRGLEVETGIPFSRLGKFERGEEMPTEEAIKKIELALDFNFGELMKCSNETSQLFDSFIDSLFYHDENNDFFKAKIKRIREKYKIKNECTKLSLIEYILFVVEEKLVEARKLEKKLFEYFYTDDVCKGILYQYKGITYQIESKNEKAIEWLEKALPMINSDKNKAMISVHLCVPYMDSRRIYESLQCLKFAERIFAERGSLKRLTYCHLEYALLYKTNRDNQLSMEYFVQVLKEIQFLNISGDFNALIYRNMCWTMILSGNYEEALTYLNEATMLDKSKANTILYRIWCNYKLGHYNEAEKIINDNKFLSDNIQFNMSYRLFSCLVKERGKKPTKLLVDYAKKMVKSLYEYEETDRIIFYIDLLLDLLNQRDDEEGKNKYLEMKISLLK